MEEDISKPPINILFNSNLVVKKNIWDIDLVSILNTLLSILNKGEKDLRICGIAALSSAIILRLKVESIFALEKLAEQKKRVRDTNIINNISLLQLPYRAEVKYPTTLEDLVKVLESILVNISTKNEKIELEPIDSKELDKYLITFEELLEEYKSYIYERVKMSGKLLFSEIMNNITPLDLARYFIALLYLAMSNKIELEEVENDILITLKTLY